MKTMIVVPVLVFLCSSFGCATSEPEPRVEQATAQLGDGQACSSDCQCDRGFRCTSGTCQSIVQFGPVPGPPLSPACVCDSQCPTGSVCSDPHNTSSSYGYCITYACTISFAPYYTPPGGTTTLTLTSDSPPGSYSLLYGQKNSSWDTIGAYYGLTSGSFSITNTPGLAGLYMRYAVLYRPDGQQLCTTAPTYSCFGTTPYCSP
jgi:hypothetical protein